MSLFSKKDNGETKQFLDFFKNILGFTPRHREVYELAFRHRSNSKELNNGIKINNERLEYLGDAVLSSIVADYLFHKYPYHDEGFLTEMRAKIVSRSNLNRVAKKIGLAELLNFRGQQQMFKFINGNAFEALIGAIYLERGYDFTRKVVTNRIISTYMDIDSLSKSEWNFKSKLIDWGQQNHRKVSFELVRTIDEGNRRQYESRVVIDGLPYDSAVDFSIKSSEQLAAEKTFKQILGNDNNSAK
ncbi:MAG: ribonuclease III [Bacteroidales bacterium]|nr:ribonuclease III [Bacteroidales bacterium]